MAEVRSKIYLGLHLSFVHLSIGQKSRLVSKAVSSSFFQLDKKKQKNLEMDLHSEAVTFHFFVILPPLQRTNLKIGLRMLDFFPMKMHVIFFSGKSTIKTPKKSNWLPLLSLAYG